MTAERPGMWEDSSLPRNPQDPSSPGSGGGCKPRHNCHARAESGHEGLGEGSYSPRAAFTPGSRNSRCVGMEGPQIPPSTRIPPPSSTHPAAAALSQGLSGTPGHGEPGSVGLT